MFDSIAECVAAYRSGKVSVREAITTQLEMLRSVDETLHAVAWFEDEAVLALAAQRDEVFARDPTSIGPLHGVPITVKDWIDVEGFPCVGEFPRLDRRPTVDATVVRRLRAAGAVIIAKTKAWGPEPPAAKAALHPVDTARSPGGSSTGEAISVVTRASLIGIGSDSGGSLRLPASWCGAIGFKPTYGAVPVTGHFPRVGERHDGRTQIGPMARSIDDVARIMSVISGVDPLDQSVPPVALDWSAVDVRGATFAVVDPLVEGFEVAAEVGAALERSATQLESIGLRRVAWREPFFGPALDITNRYWMRSTQTGSQVDQQLMDWDKYRHQCAKKSANIDVLLGPTTLTVAPLRSPVTGDHFVCTLPASLTGAPAIAIPAGIDGNGLPLSVQLIGRLWRDQQLLSVARLLV